MPTKYRPYDMCVPLHMEFSFPRTLPKPSVHDVNSNALRMFFPDLAGLPPPFIRDMLQNFTPGMLAAVNTAFTVDYMPPDSPLPNELDIVVNECVAASCPSHILGVYCETPLDPPYLPSKILIATHSLILMANCSHLDPLPVSTPDITRATATSYSSYKTVKLPVVPLNVPSPHTYPMLQEYLYSKNTDDLLAYLLPGEDFPLDIRSVKSIDRVQLVMSASRVIGLWRNACALGVVNDDIWGVIAFVWIPVVGALAARKGITIGPSEWPMGLNFGARSGLGV